MGTEQYVFIKVRDRYLDEEDYIIEDIDMLLKQFKELVNAAAGQEIISVEMRELERGVFEIVIKSKKVAFAALAATLILLKFHEKIKLLDVSCVLSIAIGKLDELDNIEVDAYDCD